MSTLLHDLRHGWRTLRRSPGFTAAAVATLALGIGANGAIFSAVDALLFAPLPFPDPGRLVHLTESYPFNERLPVALPNFLDWERASRSFEELAVYRGEEVALGDGRGEPARLQAGVVSADLLPLLGAVPRTVSPGAFLSARLPARVVAWMAPRYRRTRQGETERT